MATENRIKLTETEISQGVNLFYDKLMDRLKEKGKGTFVSRHEIQGVVTGEYHELVEAVEHESLEQYKQELLDVAVGCVFGVACIEAKKVDW